MGKRFTQALDASRAGETVDLTILRDGASRTLEVTLDPPRQG